MRTNVCIAVALAIATLVVYWQVGSCAFLRYDDLPYVTGNLHVQGGVTGEALKWAFSTMHAANWHPLTWVSHMLDCQLYGLNPRGHHFTNLCFHIVNTLLLFFLFTRMTGATWRSAFVAALFALHPLHVESVAWVAERKDVLSTFFWFLTMLLYAGYVARPNPVRYLSVVLCFAAGLMAKPMLVTLPFVLLLMDYWPLCRVPGVKAGTSDSGRAGPAEAAAATMPVRFLIREKIPLLALAVLSSIITFYAQRKGGAVSSLESVPFGARLINALVAWADYVGKMVWPRNLSVIYPLDSDLPAWQALVAGIALTVVTVALLYMARRRPHLIVGWFWYLGTLVPVIGLVQVGVQAMADRYTYIPLVGLFVMISWGIPELVGGWRYRQALLAGCAATVLFLLSLATWQQVGYWRDGFTLFSRAISATSANYFAQNEVGVALADQGRFDEAYAHLRESLRLEPRFADTHYNLGLALAQTGKLDDAIDQFREALRLKPEFAEAHNNLALAYSMKGLPDQALEQLLSAERFSPDDAGIQYNLGVAYRKRGLSGEALRHFERAARLDPSDAAFRRSLTEMTTAHPQSK